ncbi:L-carnitine dehydrogenase, partial [Streptomyces sp. AC563]|nr:L-carnitine dehydrogenase [Streptomyces buecherae]
MRRLITAAWPAVEQLGLADGASPDRLTVTDTLDEAVAEAQFVQESAPEKLELKRDLLAEL